MTPRRVDGPPTMWPRYSVSILLFSTANERHFRSLEYRDDRVIFEFRPRPTSAVKPGNESQRQASRSPWRWGRVRGGLAMYWDMGYDYVGRGYGCGTGREAGELVAPAVRRDINQDPRATFKPCCGTATTGRHSARTSQAPDGIRNRLRRDRFVAHELP